VCVCRYSRMRALASRWGSRFGGVLPPERVLPLSSLKSHRTHTHCTARPFVFIWTRLAPLTRGQIVYAVPSQYTFYFCVRCPTTVEVYEEISWLSSAHQPQCPQASLIATSAPRVYPRFAQAHLNSWRARAFFNTKHGRCSRARGIRLSRSRHKGTRDPPSTVDCSRAVATRTPTLRLLPAPRQISIITLLARR
jgi:hypothetical protein